MITEFQDLVSFLGWQTWLFGLFIYMLCEGPRRLLVALQAGRPRLAAFLASELWHNVLLGLVLPTLLGAVLAYKFAAFPYPDVMYPKALEGQPAPVHEVPAPLRVMYGFVVGAFATLLYRVVKGYWNKFVKDKGIEGAEA